MKAPKQATYETRKIKHPTLNNRNITLVYINNKLDIPSLSFLVEEARNGGQKGSVSGKMTHIGRAYKIIELYRELNLQGLDWWEAEEEDVRIIRNRMLCWDMNDNKDYVYYEHEPIENDTMNSKLAVWMKFFKHQHVMGEYTRMTMETEMVKVWLPDAFLQHIGGTRHGERSKMVERWKLMVRPSPRKLYYPAISELEFEAFRSQLRKIDIVFDALALLMVKTGLRIDAALNFDKKAFESWMKHINNGKTMDDEIPVRYINKGGDFKECDLPIETIHELQGIYRASEYKPRLVRYQEEWGGEDEPLWLRKDGKTIYYTEVQKAFKQASEAMGRQINNITPHHLRHTYATWHLIKVSKRDNIPLGIIGAEPHPMLMSELMRKLGHVSSASTLRYTMTAYKLLPKAERKNGDMVVLTPRGIQQNKSLRKMLLEKAIEVYGDEFDEDKYDVLNFAIKEGFAVDD